MQLYASIAEIVNSVLLDIRQEEWVNKIAGTFKEYDSNKADAFWYDQHRIFSGHFLCARD
jgi:hypothetical protein